MFKKFLCRHKHLTFLNYEYTYDTRYKAYFIDKFFRCNKCGKIIKKFHQITIEKPHLVHTITTCNNKQEFITHLDFYIEQGWQRIEDLKTVRVYNHETNSNDVFYSQKIKKN